MHLEQLTQVKQTVGRRRLCNWNVQGETQLTQDFEEVHFMDETPKWRGIEQVA